MVYLQSQLFRAFRQSSENMYNNKLGLQKQFDGINYQYSYYFI